MKKTFMKICALLFVCTALLIAFSLGSERSLVHSSATETDNNDAIVIEQDTVCRYRYFNRPSALFATSDGFIVADNDDKTSYAVSFDTLGVESHNKKELPPDTEKFYIYGDTYITLANGILRADNTELGRFTDFAVLRTASGSTLYAIDGNSNGTIYALALSAELSAENVFTATECDKPLKKIAAHNNGIYVTVASDYDVYCDDILYCSPSMDEYLYSPVVCFTDSDEILAMASANSGLVCLTRNGIYLYAARGEATIIQTKVFHCTDAVTISADGNTVYGISRLKSVFRLDSDLKERVEILASAHNEKGFYRANSGIASRGQIIAVCDELNGRVQLISADGISVIEPLYRPKAVAIDYVGTLYIAHDLNKISVYDSARNHVRTFSAGEIIITDLKIDSKNNLFALSRDGQIYKIENDTFVNACNEHNAVAIAVAQSDDALYAATTENKIVKITDKAQTEIIAAEVEIIDFCTDHKNNFYILDKSGNIVKYSAKYSYTSPTAKSFSTVNATKIIMNTAPVERLSLEYGDILISDTGAHAIRAIDGNILEVNKGFEISTEAPEISAPEEPAEINDSGIIFEIYACNVYAQNAELNIVATLPDGMRVIIPEYDKDAPFNYIIADNLSEGVNSEKAVTGYIYTSLIKHALPYSAPIAESCYPYMPNVRIYKYPTLNSKPVSKTLDRNTKLTLLSFVRMQTENSSVFGYADNFYTPSTWYRVSYDGIHEGYVISDSISMRGENPDDRNVYPRTNATVISKDKNNKNLPAIRYEKNESGEIAAIEDSAYPPLAVGTKVEVVGSFDSSTKYTLVRYYQEGIGTLEFYLETANLKYNGINKVVIIAIVIIILTVILGTILVIRFLHVKRTHKLSDTKL